MTRSHTTLRVDEYVRVSRFGAGAGLGPDLQHEKIAGHAKLHGLRIVKRFDDLDKTGANTDRPGFQAVLERIETGKSDGMIVARLDRFARSVVDGLQAIRRIHDANGHLIIVENGLDTTTPMGRAFMTILLAFAQLEWERIRDNWDEVNEQAAAAGIHVSSKVPFGYVREHKRLVPDPEHAALVRRLFKARADGAAFSDLLAMLPPDRALPVRTENGLRAMLRNRVYLGEARAGRKYAKADAHKALVSQDVFSRVQNLRQKAHPRNGNGGALLSGLLRCQGCRYCLGATTAAKVGKPRRLIYRCHGKHASGTCQARAGVEGARVEAYVERVVLDAFRGGRLSVESNVSEDLVTARAKVAAAELELSDFVMLTPASLDRAIYTEGLEQRQVALDAAQAELDALSSSASDVGEYAELDVVAAWPELSVSERRHVLAAFIDAVFVRKGTGPIEERVVVLYRGEGPVDLPSRGRRGAVVAFTWPSEGYAAAR